MLVLTGLGGAGSRSPQMLHGIFSAEPNASRFDKLMPFGLSLYQLSLFDPAISLLSNTTEIYHSGIKLDDPVTKEKTHDYLLISSPRRVKSNTVGIVLLARVPVQFDVWPKEVRANVLAAGVAAPAASQRRPRPSTGRVAAPAASQRRPRRSTGRMPTQAAYACAHTWRVWRGAHGTGGGLHLQLADGVERGRTADDDRRAAEAR